MKRETLTLPLMGRWFEVTTDPIIDKRGKLAGAVHIIADITERKKAEEKIKENEKKFSNMFNANPSAILITTLREGRIREINESGLKIFGYKREEIIGHTVKELNLWADYRDREAMIKKLKNKEFLRDMEIVLLRKSGEAFDMFASVNVIDIEGEPCLIATGTDITERKQAEEEIRKFKTIADRAGYGVVISDLEGNLLYLNESFAKMHGYTAEELIGRNLSVFHNEEQMENVDRLKNKLQEMGSYIAEEVWHIRKDGTFFPTLMHGTLVRDARGKPLFMAATAIDITKQKQAEDTLKEREERYRLLFNNVSDAVFVHEVAPDASDPSRFRFIEVNDNACRYLGYSREELLQMSVLQIDAPETLENIPALLNKLFTEGRATWEGIHIHKDGHRIPVEISIQLFKLFGKPMVLSSVRDITERKKAEEVLQKSEERYRDLYDNAPDMYHTLNKNGVILNCNETEAKVLGYKKEEIIGRHITDFFTEESKRLFESDFPQLKEKKVLLNIEREFIRKDGTTFPAILNIFAEYDEKGNFVGTKTISRDVTIRKRAEKETLKAKEFSDSLITLMQDGFSVLDSHGVHINVNPALCQMTGFLREELIGTGPPHPYWPPEEYKKIEEAFQKTLQGEFTDFELIFMRKNGDRFPVIVSPSWIKDKEGNIVSFFATVKDITERRRVEKEMAKLSRQYELILNSAGEGIFGVDLHGNHTFVNPAAAKMLGYKIKELIGKQSHAIWHHTRADGSPYLEEECPIYAAFKNGKVHRVRDEVFWRKDGTSFLAAYTSTPIKEKGKLIGAVVAFRDITKQKQAEDALKEREERYRLLFNNVSDAVFVHEVAPDASDPSRFRFIEVNDNACQYLGYSREEFLQMSVLQIDAPETLENIPNILKKLFTEKRATWEGIHVSKDRRRIPVEISIQLFELYGKPMVLSSVRDITERKRIEEQLRDFHEMKIF
ncbi:MAG: PAS domain S-box protein, partial [Nitrospira sp.]|nr:PAS domain S-box protein [Nitrospira sp.]